MGIVSDAAESAQREGVTTLLPSAAEQQAPFLPQGRVGAFHTHSLSTEALGTAAGKATAPAPARDDESTVSGPGTGPRR